MRGLLIEGYEESTLHSPFSFLRNHTTSKCPLCGKPISEVDLVTDKKLEKQVRKAKKQKSRSNTGVVKL